MAVAIRAKRAATNPMAFVRVIPRAELQHIRRTATTCIAHVPVTSTGALQFSPMLLAAMVEVAPGAGFPVQRQQGIDIVTVMFQGNVIRRDTACGHGFAGPEDVSVLSAGCGVEHEDSALAGDPALAAVFWLRSQWPDAAPRFAKRTVARVDRLNQLRLVATANPKTSEVLAVNADVTVHTGVLAVGVEVTHVLAPKRRAYVVSNIGRIRVDGAIAEPGDRVWVNGPGAVRIRALESTEVVVLTA